jgi:integrase
MKQPECLVFPSPKGKVINTNNFLKQVWGAVIKGLVEAGEVSEYLPQYNARHTFITLCLQSHVDIVTLAQWVGNSPEVILQNYAGANSYIQVPEL